MRLLFLLLFFLTLRGYGQELTETKSTFQNYDEIRDLKFISTNQVLANATAFNNGLTRTILTRFNNGVYWDNALALTSAGNNNLGYMNLTAGGDLLLAGMAVLDEEVGSAPTVVKMTIEGTVIWTSSFAGEGVAGARDVVETENGFLRGINFNVPLFSSTLFTMDANGVMVDQNQLLIDGGAALIMNHHYAGSQTSIYGGVFPDPNSGQLLPFVIKVEDGAVEWCKTFDAGIVLNETEFPDFLMDVTDDGHIFLATTHSSLLNANGNEVVLTKLNQEGEVLWSRISDSTPVATVGLFLEASVSGDAWFGFSYITDVSDMILSRWNADGEASVFVASNTPSRLLSRMVEKEDLSLVLAGINLVDEDSYLVEVGPEGQFPCGAETREAYFSAHTVNVEDRTAAIIAVETTVVEGEISTLVVNIETAEECSVVLGTKEEFLPLFEVYPNPTRELLTVSFNSPGIHRVSIMNATGKLVAESLHAADQATIDVTSLANGLYLIQSDGKTERFIKE